VFGSSGALAIGLVAGVLHALRGAAVVDPRPQAAAPMATLAGRRPSPVR
jgi:hypothetical protein